MSDVAEVGARVVAGGLANPWTVAIAWTTTILRGAGIAGIATSAAISGPVSWG